MSLEALFLNQVRAAGLPAPVKDYAIYATRPGSLAYAWPDHRVAIDVTGIAACGDEVRHAAEAAGWTVIQAKQRHMRDGSAVRQAAQAIDGYEPSL